MGIGMMQSKRRILLNEPHIVKPTPAGVLQFNTDMAASLKSCRVYFNPVQSGTSDSSPTNVRPISGWTGIDVTRSGENIVDVHDIFTNGSLLISGAEKIKYRHITTENGTYKVFTNVINNTNSSIASVFAAKQKWTAAPGSATTGVFVNAPRTISVDAKNMDIGIRVGSAQYLTWDETSFSPYYIIATLEQNILAIQINWTTEAGTVYGGYVDLVTGALVATWGIAKTTTSNTTVRTGSASSPSYAYPYGRYMRTALSNCKWNGSDLLIKCNALSFITSTSVFQNGATGFQRPGAAANYYWKTPDCATEEGAEALRSGEIYFCYPLATPVTYQLDPVTIKTLKGLNNIWSDANGNIELSYWTH